MFKQWTASLQRQNSYQRLPGTNDDIEDVPVSENKSVSTPSDLKSHIHQSTRYFGYIWRFLVVSLAVWGLLDIGRYLRSVWLTSQPISCNCGNSISEAIANGCAYDPISVAWLPAACRDDELIAEFSRVGDGPNGTWLHYADKEGAQLLSLGEVALFAEPPARPFYSSQEWHIAHCTYNWKKQFRAKMTGIKVEETSDQISHISHCHKINLSRKPLKKLSTVSGIKLNADVLSPNYEKHHDD